jgi:hypothetical protein
MTATLGVKTLGSEWVAVSPEADVTGYAVISERGDELGRILDYILDESGEIRYLALETGLWIFGKKVLIPVGLCRIDATKQEVTVKNFDRNQIDAMPAFEEIEDVDRDYELDLLTRYDVAVPDLNSSENNVAAPFPYDQFDIFKLPEQLRVLEAEIPEEDAQLQSDRIEP